MLAAYREAKMKKTKQTQFDPLFSIKPAKAEAKYPSDRPSLHNHDRSLTTSLHPPFYRVERYTDARQNHVLARQRAVVPARDRAIAGPTRPGGTLYQSVGDRPGTGEASGLARDFEAVVTLMAVYVLPYPSPLQCQEGIRTRLEAELTALARTSPAAIRVKLVFARDRADAYLGQLRRQSLVVIGTRDRWWRTSEERLARRLTAAGHSVAVIKVR